MKLSTRATVIAGVLLLGLTGCVPTTPTPTPTTTSSTTPTPTLTSTPSADPEEAEVTAAVVVMTASTLSVFGTDGSTLASVTYEMDGAAAAAQIAEALDEEPVVTPVPGDVESPCPPATSYEFGGLQLRSPGSLWATASYEVIVTAASTSGGIGIETLAGQQIGATQSSFQTAIGEFMVLYEDPNRIGFDVLNPEAHEWDRIGAYAEFSGGTLVYLAAPNRLGFIGSCA
ncbi:hypothetical protein [Pseudolysinimonas sp.]|uniref:hypothetical protein n=1 Tax=Pseudolysinimonas sp. TaxID=2680009 RepID=UPI00286AAFEF|nr:hypothetical protein [Pseudolysinimonas sp.]